MNDEGLVVSRARFSAIFGLGVTLAAPLACGAAERDEMVREAIPADGTIHCFVRQKGWFADTTGTCQGFVPPERILVGWSFTANSKVRIIGVIKAMQSERDLERDGIKLKSGQWLCSAAETEANLQENAVDVLWLAAGPCLPVN